MIRKFLSSTLIFLLSCGTVFAVTFPNYQNYVTDTSNIISEQSEAELNLKLKNYEAETGTEIAVVTIPLIEGLTANEYATKLGNEWGVGKEGVDNGAVLLIETDDQPGKRDIYIATGSQLEGGLTDIESRDIVDYVIIPHFRNGEFDSGVIAGVDAMLLALEGESFTSLRSDSSGEQFDVGGIIFFAIFFIFPWLGAILGRSKRVWPGGALGVVGGGVGGLIFSFALWGIIAAAVGLGIFGLLFDMAVSRNYANAKKTGGHVAWWAGGGRSGSSGFGGGGFGGFGGGGFSGGGGGSSW